MKRYLLLFILSSFVMIHAVATLPWLENKTQLSQYEELEWEKDVTFLKFLELHSISQDLYWNQSVTDQELCAEITAGINYQVLKNNNNEILQVLIPISEEMQIHLSKNPDGSYEFDIIPIVYIEINDLVTVSVNSIPSVNIVELTGNNGLANALIRTFKNTVNFRGMKKGDNIVIDYTHKIRMGQYFGSAHIKSALVEVNGQMNYMFKNEDDDKYYNEKGKSLTSYFFKIPLRYNRISSRFTNKRWHPVLKRYRAHLGVDFAAPTGRAIYASADGKIIYRGRKGGYGNTIEIRHKSGYKTLYGHLSKFKGGLRNGSYVKQGQLIGYVGSTGLSSGPHLHFGLYKNGRAINPLKIVKVETKGLAGNKLKAFKKYAQQNIQLMQEAIQNPKSPFKIEQFEQNQVSLQQS